MKGNTLPEAQAWVEQVTYVECPKCGETIELGSDVRCGDDDTDLCKCGAEFKIIPPKE